VIENTALYKSKKFATKIIRLGKFLHEQKKEFVLSKQILRSGTSIGANLAESECASSRKDFLNKKYIALKETNETLYWLDSLRNSGYLTQPQYESVYSDCMEIKKMLVATTKTISMEKPQTSNLRP
jgi:four helix bundle protein